jgi:hypothetical protein
MQSKTMLHSFVGLLLFANMAAAEIASLCNTGQTHVTATGCTGVLVPPNPTGGGPNRDGNWALAAPYPSTLSAHGPCGLTGFVPAWVDYNNNWLSNGASPVSEWITPYDGEGYYPAPGWYVYRTGFHVPSLLPGGIVPTGVTLNGRLASDNSTYGFYMASPANGGSCAFVEGLPVPISPLNGPTFQQWWDFSFTNPIAITPGADLFLYVVVQNEYDSDFPNGDSSTGLRVEFLDTSSFH